MKTASLKIRATGDGPFQNVSIELDGNDVTKYCTAVNLDMEAKSVPKVTLRMYVGDIDIDDEAVKLLVDDVSHVPVTIPEESCRWWQWFK